MFWEFIAFLIIAFLVTSIFFYGFKRGGPWTFWVFLLMLFLAAWAGRLWITPIGPEWWGVAWVPLVSFVFIVGLLIAIATPRKDTTGKESKTGAGKPTGEATAAFGIFFWSLIILLLAAIIAGLLSQDFF